MARPNSGISGFASYMPPHRVQLAQWCQWTGDQFDKIHNVVGNSFRMCGANENAYTMAATAVLRLIEQYDVDPQSIGYLALGTESSTDNSAGAVIVKGMVNRALREAGRSEISRACEVPEFKHACLGGVYALKAANRYLATDGHNRTAIVVCADIAEYERASSGEPTQGAGAVAMLVEAEPNCCLSNWMLAAVLRPIAALTFASRSSASWDKLRTLICSLETFLFSTANTPQPATSTR